MANKVFNLIALFALVVVSGCQVQQPVDGTIAFSRLTGDYWQIWTMQPDGKAAKQITTSPADKRYPAWGKDGQGLLFRTNNNQVFSVSLDAGEENRILATLGLIGRVVPSPDSSKLLLVRLKTQLRDSSALWLTTLEGKDSRILTRDAGLQYDPAWSPDGKRIAYISSHGYRTAELYTIASDGRNKLRLTDNKAIELLPAFAPDGKTIAYVSDVTGDYEIWLMDSNGGNRRQLTDNKGIDTRPYWSPDGNKIMFVSNRSGVLQLWIMNSDGSNPQELTAGAPSMDPTWRRE